MLQWFDWLGINIAECPTNLAEFMPYFFNVLLGFCCVAGIFQLIRWGVDGMTKGGRNL